MQSIPRYRELVKTFTHLPVANQQQVNIGDAIQTIAARDLWGVHSYCYRNHPEQWTEDMVVPLHGWYGKFFCQTPAKVYLIGIHLDYLSRAKILQDFALRQWLKKVQKDQDFPALARDTSTRDFFRSINIPSEFAGCVSQPLPRYDGPRQGVLNVDKRWCGSGDVIYQTYTTRGMPELADLITVGEKRLNELRTAQEVWTARLHVFLPCRAIGTKVNLREIMETHEPHRFSGLVYSPEPRTYDLTLGSTEAE